MAKTKREPTDATMRNVKAARARHEALEARIEVLEAQIARILERLPSAGRPMETGRRR